MLKLPRAFVDFVQLCFLIWHLDNHNISYLCHIYIFISMLFNLFIMYDAFSPSSFEYKEFFNIFSFILALESHEKNPHTNLGEFPFLIEFLFIVLVHIFIYIYIDIFSSNLIKVIWIFNIALIYSFNMLFQLFIQIVILGTLCLIFLFTSFH